MGVCLHFDIHKMYVAEFFNPYWKDAQPMKKPGWQNLLVKSMNNSCEVSSQKIVYLTNLITMFNFVFGKPGTCF